MQTGKIYKVNTPDDERHHERRLEAIRAEPRLYSGVEMREAWLMRDVETDEESWWFDRSFDGKTLSETD